MHIPGITVPTGHYTGIMVAHLIAAAVLLLAAAAAKGTAIILCLLRQVLTNSETCLLLHWPGIRMYLNECFEANGHT